MQHGYLFLPILLLAFTACSVQSRQAEGVQAAQLPTVAQPGELTSVAASSTAPNAIVSTPSPVEPDDSVDRCPVTLPPNPLFAPPPPYPPDAPYPNEFWYGTDNLWTMLRTDGTWQQLPHNTTGYTQKVFWWRQGYNWQAEPEPKLTVTGRRLDASAPPLLASTATNGYHPDLESFMLVGVDIPTLGCWEITGRIDDHELSFVVRVAP